MLCILGYYILGVVVIGFAIRVYEIHTDSNDDIAAPIAFCWPVALPLVAVGLVIAGGIMAVDRAAQATRKIKKPKGGLLKWFFPGKRSVQ